VLHVHLRVLSLDLVCLELVDEVVLTEGGHEDEGGGKERSEEIGGLNCRSELKEPYRKGRS
jgi:hypothetical protein